MAMASLSSSWSFSALPILISLLIIINQYPLICGSPTPSKLTSPAPQLEAGAISPSSTLAETNNTSTTSPHWPSGGPDEELNDQQQQQKPPRRQQIADDEYLIGVGIADITGPAADINLMGYAKPNQDAGGIHLRQFSRSIIIEQQDNHEGGQRVLYISLDNGMISQLLRMRVLSKLAHLYGQQVFNENNVMMSGGFFQYFLYNIPSAGFASQTLEALVSGIVRSVERAMENIEPGRIYFNQGQLLDASINRSPTSYENNPAKERARYKHNTDTSMQLLRMVDRRGKPLAMLNWFAVHGTSMNNTNHLISGDNKGYASILFEEEFNPAGTLPGKGKFVAIFAQANEGDVSPNTRGPRCSDSGLPCDLATSTCGDPPRVKRGRRRRLENQNQQQENEGIAAAQKRSNNLPQDLGRSLAKRQSIWSPRRILSLWQAQSAADKVSPSGRASNLAAISPQTNALAPGGERQQVNEKCIASGPGKDMFESTKIIAHKQYFKARQLFLDQANQEQIRGPIKFIHEHIDITRQIVPLYKSAVDLAQRQPPERKLELNETYHTCLAGLGYSFAAGTTDGPGAFDFQQGNIESTRLWNMVRNFIRRPSDEQVRCHHPKPILLATGEMDFPSMWHPKIVPTQLFMIGQLAIVGLPGEFTTMAGRRVRNLVEASLRSGATSGTNLPTNFDADDYDGDSNTDLEAGGRGQIRKKRAYSMANDIKVVLSGLSNIYTSYVTTLEEYDIQRYEGASTLYGPHTLQAYLNQFQKLAKHLISGDPLPDQHLSPPDLSKSLFTLKTGVIFDGAPSGRSFGSVLQDVDTNRTYRCQDLITVSFVAGNPRNDLRTEDSFLYVDRYNGNGTWTPIASDSSWDTKFIWERTNTIFGESRATVVWDIPRDCQSGVYRIRHYGAHKSLMQTISQYEGRSSLFKVSSPDLSSDLGGDYQSDGGDKLDLMLRLAIESDQLLMEQQHQQAIENRRHQQVLDKSEKSSILNQLYAPFNLIGSWLGLRP